MSRNDSFRYAFSGNNSKKEFLTTLWGQTDRDSDASHREFDALGLQHKGALHAPQANASFAFKPEAAMR